MECMETLKKIEHCLKNENGEPIQAWLDRVQIHIKCCADYFHYCGFFNKTMNKNIITHKL